MNVLLLPETTATIQSQLRPERVEFWGDEYTVEPALVAEIFGDGAQVIGLQPLNTRPQFYVVRVDSAWSISNWDDGDLLIEHLDEIYESIEGEYGCAYYEEDCDCSCGHCDGDSCIQCECDCIAHGRPWPALNEEVGSGWFSLERWIRRAAA